MGTFDTPIYAAARKSRLRNLLAHVGPAEIKWKSVLELGCGTGEIGQAFEELGARVSSVDARPEHIAELTKRFPYRRTHLIDVESDQFPGRLPGFDIVLCWGLLYHLNDPETFLKRCAQIAPVLYLETQVIDSDESKVLCTAESGADQSFTSRGCRPSPKWIETTLTGLGFHVRDISGPSANWTGSVFDWTPLNDGLSVRDGCLLRKMYVCKKP
jgi:SAM-dependent methyltransferase